MSDASKTETVNEQIRQAIRRHFRPGQRFATSDVRSIPELSHILNVSERLHYLAESGFLTVRTQGQGNRASNERRQNRFELREIAKGGVTVSRDGSAYHVALDARWSSRMDSVTTAIGISPVVYLRELIESDLARRAIE